MNLEERLDAYRRSSYWDGHHCVPLGMPWFVPGATELLIGHSLRGFLKHARVLELGCGGSTLFFSELAKEVVSVETDLSWLDRMKPLKPNNVKFEALPRQGALDHFAEILKREPLFDVVLVDNNPEHMPRGAAASLIFPYLHSKAIFITDNYYLTSSMVAEFTVPSDWTHIDFNDKHWHGCGTRVSFRGF